MRRYTISILLLDNFYRLLFLISTFICGYLFCEIFPDFIAYDAYSKKDPLRLIHFFTEPIILIIFWLSTQFSIPGANLLYGIAAVAIAEALRINFAIQIRSFLNIFILIILYIPFFWVIVRTPREAIAWLPLTYAFHVPNLKMKLIPFILGFLSHNFISLLSIFTVFVNGFTIKRALITAALIVPSLILISAFYFGFDLEFITEANTWYAKRTATTGRMRAIFLIAVIALSAYIYIYRKKLSLNDLVFLTMGAATLLIYYSGNSIIARFCFFLAFLQLGAISRKLKIRCKNS